MSFLTSHYQRHIMFIPYLVPQPVLVINILHDVHWLVGEVNMPAGALSLIVINLRLFGVRILSKALSLPVWWSK